MKFKLVLAMVSDKITDIVVEKAREMGATGATVITSARGEGIQPTKTFFGLTVEGQIDVALFIVEEHISRRVVEGIAEAGEFDKSKGSGVVLQLDIEDAIGLKSQLNAIKAEIEEQI
ncbi:MAG: P-II family nitrogen regulator [Pseudomonadota bacterium]